MSSTRMSPKVLNWYVQWQIRVAPFTDDLKISGFLGYYTNEGSEQHIITTLTYSKMDVFNKDASGVFELEGAMAN